MLRYFSKKNKMLKQNKKNILSYTIITKKNYGIAIGSIKEYINEIIERNNRRMENEK